MAVTETQYQQLLSRLTKTERTLNDIIAAIERFVSLQQVNEVFTVLQQDIASLTSDVEALTDRVETLEEEPYDEGE